MRRSGVADLTYSNDALEAAVAGEAAPTTADTALNYLDGKYSGLLDQWLPNMYNSGLGAFKKSASVSGTDIQSSAQALKLINLSGLLSTMPSDVRQDIETWWLTRQSSADHFFYDYAGQNLSDRDKGRYLSYAKSALEILSLSPEYSYPGDGDMPSELATPETYYAWLQSLDWTNPWSSGDKVDANANFVVSLSNKSDYYDKFEQFMDSIQSSATGYWGSSSSQNDYVYLSGAAKITATYQKFNRTVPGTDKLFSSFETTINTYSATDSCHVRNALWLLSNIKSQIGAISINKQISIINKSADNIALFKNSDGGFSRSLNGESNMDGASQAMLVKYYSYVIVAERADSGNWPGTTGFWSNPMFSQSSTLGNVRFINKNDGLYLKNSPSDGVVMSDYVQTWSTLKWTIEDSGDGYVWIKNLNDNKYLRDSPSAGVIMSDFNGTWSTLKWTIEDTGDGYIRLKNKNDGKYLKSSPADGVVMSDFNAAWSTLKWQAVSF